MDDLVFHTLDVMDALGLPRADVVGLSLGGWLAAELAVRHPERVQRLVLVDAAGTRVPGVERPDLFLAPAPKARELLFADPTSALATSLIPDVSRRSGWRWRCAGVRRPRDCCGTPTCSTASSRAGWAGSRRPR